MGSKAQVEETMVSEKFLLAPVMGPEYSLRRKPGESFKLRDDLIRLVF